MMIKLYSKFNITKVTQLMLSLLMFVVIIDPTNSIFKLKEILFAITISLGLLSTKKIDAKLVLIVFFIYFFFYSSLVAGFSAGYEFGDGEVFRYSKAFLFVSILLIVGNPNLDLFKTMIVPCVIVGILTIIVYIMYVSNPMLEAFVYMLSHSADDTILMFKRSYYGIEVVGIFYKTVPMLTIPLSYYYYDFLSKKEKILRNLIYSIIFFTALMMSGTRANMFAASLIILIITLTRLRKSIAGILMMLPLSFIILSSGSFLAYKMLTEQGEHSVEVKGGHQESITSLIADNANIALFGQGPGSLYFTSGWGGMTSISELSYHEMIRMFGFIGGGFIIFVFFYPLFLAYRNKQPNYFAFNLGYLAYLFIGGTNPLLMSSTGFLILAIAYSYSLKSNESK